jgi:hypothetical protein
MFIVQDISGDAVQAKALRFSHFGIKRLLFKYLEILGGLILGLSFFNVLHWLSVIYAYFHLVQPQNINESLDIW